MATSDGPNISSNGLVLCLDAADKNSYPGSGTTWYDLCGLGGSGVLTNSPSFNSANGGYFSFSGATDYIRFTRSDLNAGSFAYSKISVCMWLMPSSSGDTGATGNNIITVETSFEFSTHNLSNGYSGFSYATNPWAWRTISGNVFQNDIWNFLAFTHDTNARTTYVNSSLRDLNTADSGNIASGSATYPYLTLGGRYSGTGSQYEGSIGVVCIYNRVLSAAEIQQNYNTTKTRFGY